MSTSRKDILLKTGKITCALLFLTIAAAPLPARAQTDKVETKDQRDARMAWWREAKFGMFIHWGIYSVPAGVYQGRNIGGLGEWIQNYGQRYRLPNTANTRSNSIPRNSTPMTSSNSPRPPA